jgi:chaperonin GroES
MSVKPIGPRVLIRPEAKKEETTKSGIILPGTSEGEHKGTIVAVPDMKELPVAKGDRVMYELMGETEVNVDGEPHIIIDIKNIIAKIE